MRIPGLKTAKHAARWLHNRIFPGAVILGYHRIASDENDRFDNCVLPDHFAQQMEVLSRYANPVSPENLVGSLGFNAPLPKTVCVTIDDGYADTLTNAKPILEKYQIPATVFVTTGNLGEEFWWDELQRTILNAPGDADLRLLSLFDRPVEGEFAKLNLASRASQIETIANILRPLDESSRRQLINEIKVWAGHNPNDQSPRARSMTPAELVSLIEGGLIQIGSHSVTHPMLPLLTESERRYEMEESKRTLEKILAKPVYGFSYPNGRYLESDPDLVSQSGYRYACASQNGTIRSTSILYKLPRFWPGNVDGKTFQKWLKLWL
jgi:peptidoglycan/xylan/chitin deacetylase (PgdA/CDA1 family)